MGALKDAINAKATPHQRAAMAAEDWCKVNGWTRICDIPSEHYEDVVCYKWYELSDSEREPWIRNYHDDAEDAWLRYGRLGSYKVPVRYIMDDGSLWNIFQFRMADLANRGFMMVFDLRESGA